MKYYKDPSMGTVFAYEADGSQDDRIPQHLVAITQDEATDLTRPIHDEASLCRWLDAVTDAARAAMVGDPLRLIEYERAAAEATAFAAAGYAGDIPPMVAAWAINGRTSQQAADEILWESARHDVALLRLRELRLQAKEQIRGECSAGRISEAQTVAEDAISAIQSVALIR